MKKNNKNKLKTIEKDDKMVYLKDGVDKLFKIHANSFNKRIIDTVKGFSKSEGIDYKNLSYKILFHDETNVKSHEINFLKNFYTLYGLLKDLVTSKIQITNANADQIRFLVYLMMGYYDKDFLLKKLRYTKMQSDSWQNKALGMARIT